MFVHKIAGCGALAAIAAFISAGPVQAAMSPMVHFNAPDIHQADCAVGFHIGPLGTCVLGAEDRPPPPRDEPPPRVIEHRSVDEGCESKSVNRTDSEGNSETRTKTRCD